MKVGDRRKKTKPGRGQRKKKKKNSRRSPGKPRPGKGEGGVRLGRDAKKRPKESLKEEKQRGVHKKKAVGPEKSQRGERTQQPFFKKKKALKQTTPGGNMGIRKGIESGKPQNR